MDTQEILNTIRELKKPFDVARVKPRPQANKTLHYIENGKYRSASVEMLDSLWAKQTPNRAKELSERMAKVDENL